MDRPDAEHLSYDPSATVLITGPVSVTRGEEATARTTALRPGCPWASLAADPGSGSAKRGDASNRLSRAPRDGPWREPATTGRAAGPGRVSNPISVAAFPEA